MVFRNSWLDSSHDTIDPESTSNKRIVSVWFSSEIFEWGVINLAGPWHARREGAACKRLVVLCKTVQDCRLQRLHALIVRYIEPGDHHEADRERNAGIPASMSLGAPRNDRSVLFYPNVGSRRLNDPTLILAHAWLNCNFVDHTQRSPSMP